MCGEYTLEDPTIVRLKVQELRQQQQRIEVEVSIIQELCRINNIDVDMSEFTTFSERISAKIAELESRHVTAN